MAPEPKEIAKGIKRESRRSNLRNDPNPGPNRMDHYDSQTSPGSQAREALHYHLCALSTRDDGYLRVIPDGAGKSVYWKWKFTRGQWIGHYVMSVVSWYDPALALLLLRQKIDAVEVGTKRPAKDTPHTD